MRHNSAHERRAVMFGRRPGQGHLRQVDPGHLPASGGEIARLHAQAATDVKRALA